MKKFLYSALSPILSQAPAVGVLETRQIGEIGLPEESTYGGGAAPAKAICLDFNDDINIDLTGTNGLQGEDLAFNTVTGVIIEIYKTAETCTGTLAVVSTLWGVSSTTVDAANDEYAHAKVGECLAVWMVARKKPLVPTSGTHIGLNFTTPVGFKCRVTVVGT